MEDDVAAASAAVARAHLRVALNTPSRLRIVMRRGATGRWIRAFDVPAGGLTAALRLPKRSHGHALRPGRYPIAIVAIDATGHRSAPVVKTLIVRR